MSEITSFSKEQVEHAINHIAVLYNLYRLPDETLSDFRRRVLSVFKYRVGTGHNGVIYGISRDLGFTPKTLGIIKLSEEDDGLVGEAPGLLFSGHTIHGWENILESPEFSIDTILEFPSESIETQRFVTDFKDYIDSSTLFEWEIEPKEEDLFLLTKNIVPSASFKVWDTKVCSPGVVELVEGNSSKNPTVFVIPGSVTSVSGHLANRVGTPEEIEEYGDFYVSPWGRLVTFNDGNFQPFTVSFSWFSKYHHLTWCPVSLKNLNDTELRDRLLRKIKATDNETWEAFSYSEELAFMIYKAYKEDKSFWFAKDTNDTPMDILERLQTADVITDPIEGFYSLKDNLRELLSGE